MDKPSIKQFINWLDHASDEAIREKKKKVIAALEVVYTSSAKSDLRLLLRLIDEEVIARLDLELVRQNR